MAKVVGGFASSHILMSSKGVEDRAQRVAEGMGAIGERIRALKPDVIVVVTNDHLFNFGLDMQVPFSIGAADSYTPFGDLAVPQIERPGHRAFAEEFLNYSAENGFDIARLESVRPDHGVSVPMLFADPSNTIPLVPIYLNLMMDPMPSAQRCWALGQAFSKFVTSSCTSAERVVVLAAGGLSHWVGYDAQVNERWDREFLADMTKGKFKNWAEKSKDEIMDEAGNGGLEIIHWLFMASASQAHKAEVIYYEPLPEWKTGMGGIQVF
jgi:2'-aminobiphenyl-2,3-diol 1,2-dioxygenase, large subunit